ncbi:MAG: GTPase Der [Hydrocarboniphaga sp.]|uniref:ribosome biogenesis GTPase Der n=1 Tax=Hydrocarboniphaga sp. TaxID=2033016 RepID=UPI00261B5B97|nr:ribosome biogenesis GTPase Der [Hydrocarboniphaga sp.]MDB5971091.1 GTPase Der [Hydrocarboniphaga sp.]
MQSGLPVLVLVGRPNVGKSTLFNRLTGTRDALVADFAGLTRDRQYGYGVFEEKSFIVVDTGGLMPESADPLAALAEEQAQMALEDADHIFFLTDAKAGRHSSDEGIAAQLRKLGKPLTLLVNKLEGRARGVDRGTMVADFYALGLGEPQPVSAEFGDGIASLLRSVLGKFPANDAQLPDVEGEVRVAIVGRPNVGKSTLVNRLIGEERVVAADKPGTTRDAIRVPFEYEGNPYTLIDTAGIRRRSRVEEVIEKFSIIKTLQAIEGAHVVIAVVDAHADIGEQDARLMGLIAQRGRAMILAVNKWDGLDSGARDQARYQVSLKMPFLDYTPVHYISAKHGSGVGVVMRDVKVAYESTMKDLPTPELTRILERSVDRHQPPAVLGRRIKLRYAHQGGSNPPHIVIHGNQTDKLSTTYKRYLANEFRDHFQLKGVPLVLSFKTGDNPFKDKKNVLTGRQVKKRQRMIKRFK